MSKTLTVEGDITAVDTRTLITTQGSVTAPSLVVPAGAKKIDKIFVASSSEGLADGSAVFLLRLGGGAVMNGEQVIAIGAAGRIAVQAGSDAAPQVGKLFKLDDAGIDVSQSDSVVISAEMAGTDVGTARVAVTLVFA
jgi:ATP-dependent protease HslVU (ClpYQ) peptidase subunit